MIVRLVEKREQATRIGQYAIAERLAQTIGRAIGFSLEPDPFRLKLFGTRRIRRSKDGYRLRGDGPHFIQIEGEIPKTMGECNKAAREGIHLEEAS